MEINDLISSKHYLVDKLDIPKVIFKTEELRVKVDSWLEQNKINISFNEILLSLGFKKTDTIFLEECDSIGLHLLNEVTLKYYLNKLSAIEENKITLSSGPTPSVTLKTINSKRKYLYETTDEIKFNLVYYSINYGTFNRIYQRQISDNILQYIIEESDYTLKIKVVKPNNLKLEQLECNSSRSNFELKNENELFQYLINLKFPISIIKVYNEICKISLDDIKKYPDFSLKFTKYNKVNRCDETLDLLHLINGNLEEFIITKDGFTLCLDQFDISSSESKITEKEPPSTSGTIIPFTKKLTKS